MKCIYIVSLFLLTIGLNAQDLSNKEKAMQAFKSEDYPAAISLMEKAQKENPNDPDVYYYLGFFNHYNAYDSRPMNGYNYVHSKKIFNYLKKAIELNPNHGNAKYFYGAECSGNAFNSMQAYDLKKLKHFYKKAYEIGAYPDWLLELGRNLLSNCDQDAILFTGGNADFDICMYLQLHENFRKDVSVIPIGNIDRPWYVKFIKNGLKGGFRKVSISLTDDQIMDMHPYKWRAVEIEIPISNAMSSEFGLSKEDHLKWKVEPDLFSDRDHAKIETEQTKKRTYLSPQKAMLLQIIEDNYKERPIFFSRGANQFFLGGLDKYTQNCGIADRLLPFKTEGTEYTIHSEKMNELLKDRSLKHFNEVKEEDIPRISGMLLMYHYTAYYYADYLKKSNQKKALKDLIELYNTNLFIGFNENVEAGIKSAIEKLNEEL